MQSINRPLLCLRRNVVRNLLLWFAVIGLPLAGSAQITITNGVQKYSFLTSTTVTLSNKCELWVTNASTPLSGCTINLNSTDSFLILSAIRPSVAASTYLSQVKISGAAAVADSNCRVVQYGVGAVIVPHSASFQPLTVYTGPQFTGASSNLSQYVYYNGASTLGVFNANISSFKLKRGYAATIAQNSSGSAYSKNYVAADGDVEVSVLPSTLDGNVGFIYVTPWRWTSKKGIAGNPGNSLLNVNWWYDWNIDQNSTRDLEYSAIRQQRWWPSLGQNWQSRGVNTVLGYNEPDSTSQANIAVGDAIWSWPDLLGTGLRVGSPATTDGGWSSWLYPFMSQADAAGLRVDFVAVHYYRCYDPSNPSGAANQLYNALKGIYDQTHRPLWITEWNNGANWTTCADPTYAQQQACIAAMISMLDNTPFVEHYSLYNWVEDVRSVVTNGVLTSAGVTYRDEYSPIGYVQALQDNGTRSYTQLRFETNTLDTSGFGNNGVTAGCPAYTNGHVGQAMVFDGTNTYVTLPPNVATNNAFSFAAWIKWNGGANWQRIFDFGNSSTHYMFLTPNSGSTMRFAIANGGSEQRVETGALASGSWQHVAFTLSGGVGKLYVNGSLVASNTSMTISPANFAPRVNRLGKSQFVSDPLFSGMMDEVLITDYALSATQIARLQTNTPPQFTSSLLSRAGATEAIAYSATVAGAATDADSGDTLTYSKTTGPTWLSIAADGTLSGVPTAGDGGTNYFTVAVTDSAGQSAFAVLTIPVTVVSATGIWTSDANANWGDTNRWSGKVIATGAGQTADFSTINITANRTVTLDSSRTIANLKFSDTSGAQTWTIAASNGCSLKLSTGTNTSPLVSVTNTATITAPVAGTNGFTKTGPGTLVLSGNNPLTGDVHLDTGSSSLNDGTTRVVGPNALANASAIYIGNNNSGFSTLQLDGSAGNITIDAQMYVTCRNSGVVTIESMSGTNVINGGVWLNVGGSAHTIQSDANSLLVFTGTNMYVGSLTGARTYYFTGSGNHLLVGPLLDSTNGAPISMAKTGSGTLTLAAVNTYSSGTTLSGGSLIVDGSLPAGTFTIGGGTTLGGNGIINAAVTLPATATLAPGDPLGALTVNNSVTLQAGSITRMAIDKGNATNDQLIVNGALTCGGTLSVTNLSGTLWAGDSFPLFNASSVAGAFAVTNLPPLSAGLVWRFNPSNGVLMVAQPGTIGTPPLAPTALGAIGSNALVNLSWVQSATADVTTNLIYRSTTGIGGPYNLLASVPANTMYVDTGVVNGQTYYYVVTAVSTNGESAWSGYASATPQTAQPYAGDTNTLVLFHFDEPAGASMATNYGTLSATTANKKAYAVNLTTATATPATVTTVLGASAYTGFGNSANLSVSNGYLIGWDANDSGAYQADSGSVGIDAISMNTLNMGNGGQTAWTLEALLFPTNATAAQSRNSEIICTDSSAASRGFQFRLTTAGQLELNFISSTSGGTADQLVSLPTTGANAYAPNTWFHVAAVYDGANVSLYWTKLVPNLGSANLLTNYAVAISSTFGAVTGPLVVGGENRGANGETFAGMIDEVRISKIARAATNFLWAPIATAPTVPINLNAAAGDAQVALNWSFASGATSYNVKRVAATGSYYTTITNLNATTFMDTDVVNGTIYYYVVSALNSAGESLNSAQVSVQPVSTAPIDVAFATSGNQLQLNWPADHTGWHLQVQTNDLTAGLGTNWVDVPNTSTTNQVTIPVDATTGSVFYRLVYP